jgi:capsular exopolysaccharide synthesis family protein
MASLRGIRFAPPTEEEVINGVAQELSGKVGVEQRGESYGIDVYVESRDPVRAALIANTLVDLYLQLQTEGRFETAQRAGGWLSQRLDQLRGEVLTKERAAEAFRVRNGLSIAAGGETQTQQSGEVQGMLVSARADLAEKSARLRQVESLLRSGRSAESMADAISAPSVQALRAQAAEVQRRLVELRQRYSDEHPAVQAAMIEQQNAREQIQEEVSRIVASLRNEVEVARARLGTLQSNYGAVGDSRGENTDAIIQYRELLRQAAAARQVHESFLQRFHELTNQGALPVAHSRLVSDATPPDIPKSSLGMALLNAFMLGAFAGIAVGLLLDLLDQSIGDADDAERKLGVPTLVSVPTLRAVDYKRIPKFRQNPMDYLADKPMSGFAESLRVLRAAIMHSRSEKKLRVLAVTSAVPQEGKTTVSVCLARVAAMSGQKVLLVDCDLRHPAVSQLLGFNSESGLFEVLNGGVDWRQAIRQDPETHARILPTVASQFSPKDVFSSQPMERLVEELRNECDLVILDCPPVLAVAETRTLVTHADAVVMVARSGHTPAGAVSAALREIESTGADVLGVALNYVDFRVPGHSGYGMYYNSAAQKYYRS